MEQYRMKIFELFKSCFFEQKKTENEVYKIKLESEHLDKDRIACTGNQLFIIIEKLKNLLIDYKWYITDVEYIFFETDEEIAQFPLAQYPLSEVPLRHQIPKLIGNVEHLMEFSKIVDQFMCAVILGVPNKGKLNSSIVYCTESREPHLKDADIDIRMFDTSFILIYTNRVDVMHLLNDFV